MHSDANVKRHDPNAVWCSWVTGCKEISPWGPLNPEEKVTEFFYAEELLSL